MSITIEKKVTINGVLTDLTSVKLKDGIIRNDTNEVIVPAGTDIPKVSTGVYQYTFDEPDGVLNLSYLYTIEWVYSGETYRDTKIVYGVVSSLAPSRVMNKYVDWIKTEFFPLTLATPDDTIKQCVENAIRYWNTHSAYKISQAYDYGGQRIQVSNEFKSVVQVYPTKTTTYIWNDHPLWTLMGISVLDNVTTDLILMTEAFRNYRQYVGADFRFMWDKSEDPLVGGWLNIVNLPAGSSGVFVIGTKRITENEDIKQEHILDWILRYSKALVKMVEGNTLRKAEIIDIKSDGNTLYTEGSNEVAELKKELSENGRWLSFILRR
jgi:hypothetical protein